MDKKSDIGLIGLGVMGKNLALNMEDKGFRVSVYNYHPEITEHFIKDVGCGKKLFPSYTLKQFVDSLERPRKIFLMIKAGDPVDEMINQLYPITDYGDLIIDGGNSFYKDTDRRCEYLESKGRLFIGCGVSGGEKGALLGPSMMPGGMKEGWHLVKNIFEKIAAKAPDGSVCCQWVGPGGAGHFVKMVHNGIEYGDLQLISEIYYLLKKMFGYNNEKISDIFKEWNKGPLSSYLIDITAKILIFKENDNKYLLDKILDTVGQKGTGKWSVDVSLDLEMPLNVIADSVYQRYMSMLKDERIDLANAYPRDIISLKHEKNHIEELAGTLYASKLICYVQGFQLMKKASQHYNWNLNLSSIASVWRAGCIIRSVFLDKIMDAYYRSPHLNSLLDDYFFIEEIKKNLQSWKRIVTLAINHELAFSTNNAALNYFYSVTTDNSPANLIQAQRDYFGAHTFERTDTLRGQFFHNDWSEE